MLNLDASGTPHKVGSVIQAEHNAYVIEHDGSFRRVQVIEQAKDHVTYRRIRAASKAEKKALKRDRQKARADLAAAALRVARRTLAGQEAHA
jgi:hypothetical protein